MLMTRLCLAFLSLILVFARTSNAQFVSSGGPLGESGGNAVFAFGDTAYIKANGYLMRTFDGGATWVQLTNGLGKFPYRVQPNCFGRIGNTIYMGTQSANLVYRSTDFGDSWTQYQDGVTWGGIPTNAVSSNGRIFMAGNGLLNLSFTTGDAAGWHATTVGGIASAISVIGRDSIWATLGGKTFYSHDNGDTWTQIAKEPLTGFGLGATDFVRAGSRILSITNGGGANTTYYSEDYGNTWKLSKTGFPSGRNFVKISDDEIYALGYFSITPAFTAISAVYRTTDRGENWIPMAQVDNGLAMTSWRNGKMLVSGTGTYSVTPGDSNALLIPFPHSTLTNLVSDGSSLYAVSASGLAVRSLAGGTWTVVSDLKKYFSSGINSFGLYDGKMYLGTDMGAFVSTDHGQNFELISPNFAGSNISGIYADHDMVFVAHLAKGIIAARDATDSIFTSINGGSSWTGVATGFPSTPGFQTRGFVNHDGKSYVFGTTGYAVSADNGASWAFTNTTEFAYTIGSRLYSFAGVLYRDRYDIGGTSTWHIDYSTNGGLSWIPDSSGLTLDVLNHPLANGVFLSNGKMYTYVNEPGKEGVAVKAAISDGWQMLQRTGPVPSVPSALIANGDDLFLSVVGESVWTNQTTTGGVERVLRTSNTDLPVYPSPARESVTVDLPSEIESSNVQIIDQVGRILLQQLIHSGDKISISVLPPGMYIVRSGGRTAKLVVE